MSIRAHRLSAGLCWLALSLPGCTSTTHNHYSTQKDDGDGEESEPSPDDDEEDDEEEEDSGGDDGAPVEDADGDGVTAAEGDCDDGDPSISPELADATVDGTDQDCDGLDGPDADGDGVADADAGGTDCDDRDATVYPGAEDVPGDGVDQDCDGVLAGESDESTRLLAEVVLDSSLYCGAGAYVLTAWDWDGDGWTDMVVTDGAYSRGHILHNTGDWVLGWTSPTTYTGPSTSVGPSANFNAQSYRDAAHATADWDLDGQEELVLVGNYMHAHAWQSGLFRELDSLDEIAIVNGPGSAYELDQKMSVIPYDWDGSPPLELIVGSLYNISVYSYDGTTATPLLEDWNRLGVSALAAGDFDGDGFDEFLLGTSDNGYDGGSYLQLMNLDGGTVLSSVWGNTDGIDRVSDLQTADMNGDGALDFLAVGRSGAWLYLNDGAGSFELAWISPEASQFASSALADLNGDGHVDILLPSDLRRFSAFLNDGSASFTDVNHEYLGQGRAVAAGDIDGDGVLDITFTNFEYDTVTPTGRNTCTISSVALVGL